MFMKTDSVECDKIKQFPIRGAYNNEFRRCIGKREGRMEKIHPKIYLLYTGNKKAAHLDGMSAKVVKF